MMIITVVKRISVSITVLIATTLIFSVNLSAVEFEENPKITHREEGVKRAQLEVVKVIKSDFDEDFFFAKPTALTVSPTGLFVYDSMLKSVFIFDKNHRFVKKFMREGRGPGETYDLSPGFHKIYYNNGKIYVCDIYNNKIIVYSDEGKYLEDIRFFRKERGYFPFKPVVDNNGNLYTLSERKGIVDKFDVNMQVVRSFVDPKLNERFAVYMPNIEDFDKRMPDWIWKRPGFTNVFYDVFGKNGLIIFMSRPSRVFVFQDDKLVREFDIFLKQPMERFRKRMNRHSGSSNIKLPKAVEIGHMFQSFFIDKDDDRFFYLQSWDKQERLALYKFNIDGTLVKIITLPNITAKSEILAKRNHLFYGQVMARGNIYIYKEEE